MRVHANLEICGGGLKIKIAIRILVTGSVASRKVSIAACLATHYPS